MLVTATKVAEVALEAGLEATKITVQACRHGSNAVKHTSFVRSNGSVLGVKWLLHHKPDKTVQPAGY